MPTECLLCKQNLGGTTAMFVPWIYFHGTFCLLTEIIFSEKAVNKLRTLVKVCKVF